MLTLLVSVWVHMSVILLSTSSDTDSDDKETTYLPIN